MSDAKKWQIHQGDVLDRLREMPDAHYSALVSDPPYGLGFMGKIWDHGVPGVEVWREVLRVLKPGAPLLAFGGTRTYHRLAVAIEDAGFEIRDCVGFAWVYGSGFPKSLSVGKAIDAAAGAVREVTGVGAAACAYLLRGESCPGHGDAGQRQSGATVHVMATAPSTAAARDWEGHGTALKPSWEPIVLARKPLDGTVANNALTHGCGALNIDGTRIAHANASDLAAHQAGVAAIKARGGVLENSWKNSSDLSGANDVKESGRWPANFCLAHHEDCRLVGSRAIKAAPSWTDNRGPSSFTGATTSPVHHANDDGTETVDAWTCVDGCAARMLDEASGPLTSGKMMPTLSEAPRLVLGNVAKGGQWTKETIGDSGGASRFFYVAKPSRAERDFGCEALPLKSAGEMTDRDDDEVALNSPRTGAGRTGGARNTHPTLKPIQLMKWLSTLVLPPARTDGEPRRVLVPFSGSGSEMIGALLAGWDEVHGIELEHEYVTIAKARLSRWADVPKHMDVKDVPGSQGRVDERQASLFSKVGT